MIQYVDQQITSGPWADEAKALRRGDTRWKGRAETYLIHRRGLIGDTARQAHTGNPLVVEVAHDTTIRLGLGDKVDSPADLNQFSGTVSEADKLKRHPGARCCPEGRGSEAKPEQGQSQSAKGR